MRTEYPLPGTAKPSLKLVTERVSVGRAVRFSRWRLMYLNNVTLMHMQLSSRHNRSEQGLVDDFKEVMHWLATGKCHIKGFAYRFTVSTKNGCARAHSKMYESVYATDRAKAIVAQLAANLENHQWP